VRLHAHDLVLPPDHDPWPPKGSKHGVYIADITSEDGVITTEFASFQITVTSQCLYLNSLITNQTTVTSVQYILTQS